MLLNSFHSHLMQFYCERLISCAGRLIVSGLMLMWLSIAELDDRQ